MDSSDEQSQNLPGTFQNSGASGGQNTQHTHEPLEPSGRSAEREDATTQSCNHPYRVLDLFSGIGGFSLGLERAGGFKTVAFCEIIPYCQRVLAKHWPGVPLYDDITKLSADTLSRDGIAVDVLCGGFPCQDISLAGKRIGIEGERSGLWKEYARLICELRPRFAIMENVPGLLSLGMGRVLGDLAKIGYDALWDCIPAAAVGAPHRRDRVWIVAYPNGARLARQGSTIRAFATRPAAREWRLIAQAISYDPIALCGRLAGLPTPFVQRGDDGVPHWVDRLRALGNAVVPQIPELIGRAILKSEMYMSGAPVGQRVAKR